MNLGKITGYSVNNSLVKIDYNEKSAYVDIIKKDIINFFIPIATSEHFSKAIEGDKHQETKIKVSMAQKTVTIETSDYIINISDDFKTDIYDSNNIEVLSDYVGQRKPRHKLSKKSLELLKAEGHDVSSHGIDEHPICMLKKMSKDTCFYGLGDKTGFINKRGYAYENWNSDIPDAHTDDFKSLYKSIPFMVAKNKKHVYGLFFDNTFKSYMDMCKESEDYMVYAADGGNLDYYFMGGKTIKEVISNYTYLTGCTPLPKLWTLGYMQCRWGYECADDIETVAMNFRKNKIPCDSVQYDIDYMEGFRVFTFDEENYGKKGELFKKLKDNEGFKPVVIIDPGVKVDKGYFMYDEGVENNYFAKEPKTHEDYINEVWPGDSVYPDFGRKEVRDWWASHVDELAKWGVEGIWNDMNEPASFRGELPKDILFSDEDRSITHAEMHNVYGHFMSKATYEGLKKATGERPFVITRACYSGTQKYSTVWTGDNQSLWAHLQMMIPQLCNLGISGYAIAGVDIGGFGADTTKELMARWIEAAFMSTFFRNHCAKGNINQEPWLFGDELIDIYRKYVELHYQFIPYIYDLLKQTSKTGVAPMRPLVLEYEDDENTYNLNSEFMVGPSMLIAPVLEPGVNKKMVYLPNGDWYNYFTHEKYAGNQWVLVDAPLDTCPIFIKGGAIIPMYEVMQYVGEKPYNKLRLLKTPGYAEYTHYKDNGIDYKYLDGEYNLYKFSGDENINTEILHKGYEDYKEIVVEKLI